MPDATGQLATAHSFKQLVLSDLGRHRAVGKPAFVHIIVRSVMIPGVLASVILRAQQCLHRSGRTKLANLMRPLAHLLVGADFGPGMDIGTGLYLAHPNGVTIGFGVSIGNNVSMAAGVTAAARYYEEREGQAFATICDGAVLGAHAVLVGGVRIGENAVVGANSVVLSDVPDNAVVMGVPARQVGVREDTA